MIVMVNPMGNFPINDDWAYTRSVLRLVENGEFQLVGFGAMTLISHVLWGALWVQQFGFSFEVLRFSTLFLGLVALIGNYYFLLRLSKDTWIALAGTFVLLVNPIFISSANSFMTDVPFLAYSFLSVFFFFRAIEQDSLTDIILATILAVVAVMLRQIALVLPLAFFLAYVARFGMWSSIRVSLPGSRRFW